MNASRRRWGRSLPGGSSVSGATLGLLCALSACADRSGTGAPPALDATTRLERRAPTGFVDDGQGGFAIGRLGSRPAATIDGRGAHLLGADDRRVLDFAAANVGRAGSMVSLATTSPELSAGGRVELRRATGLTEWYVSAPAGLEHGLDLADRPAGEGPLRVEMATEGLTPVLATPHRVDLRRPDGSTVASYGNLEVRDADGQRIASALRVEGDRLRVEVDDAEARYPLSIDPLIWGVQIQEITPAGITAGASFGGAVSFDGTTMLVGASGVSSAKGEVFFYTSSGGTWTPVASFNDPAATSGDRFGDAVAVSGTLAAVGAYASGKVYVYSRTGATWAYQATITGTDTLSADGFGGAVSTDGTSILVGANNKATFTGAAYVFTSTAGSWSQQAKLVASDGVTNDNFGISVSIAGGLAIVGANGKNSNRGAAYVFSRTGTTWAQQAELSGAAANDNFGRSVALYGTSAVVGAPGSNGTIGSGYEFVQSGTTWPQHAQLTPTGVATGTGLGTALAFGNGGNTVILGAQLGPILTARASVFEWNTAGHWDNPANFSPSDGISNDGFGTAAALSPSGAVALIGAGNGAATHTGHAYVYTTAHANGDACTLPTDCVSGYCVARTCSATAPPADAGSDATGGTDASGATDASSGTDAASAPDSGAGADTGSDGGADAGTTTATDASDATDMSDASPETSSDTGSVSVSDAIGDSMSVSDLGADVFTPVGPDASTPSAVKIGAVLCKADGDCAHAPGAHCVAGVCCDSPCNGKCMSCALPGSPGVCSPVPAGTDPYQQCGALDSCDSTCDGRGGCITAFLGAECAPNKCTGTSTGVGPAFCSATMGTCNSAAVAQFECSPYACSPPFGACLQACTTSADCATGYECDTSVTPGRCIAIPTQSGGGCSVGGTSSTTGQGAGYVALGALGLLGAARRQRRRTSYT